MKESSRLWERFSLPLEAAWSALLYFLVEAISRHSLYAAWVYMTQRPLVFAYNMGLVFATMLLVHLTRRRIFARTFVSVFWLLLGIINGFLLTKRVTPFTGTDVRLLGDAIGVMKKYLPLYGVVIGCVLFALLVIALVILFFRAPKYQGPLHRGGALLLVLLGVGSMALLTRLGLSHRLLSGYFGNIAFAYEDYGYPYGLMTTIFNIGIDKPADYSGETVEGILKSCEALPESRTEDLPNVIFLQLESFIDPLSVSYLCPSEDPIPVFRSLMRGYSSGLFKVPSVGAGTANTEFETMTGMSLHYFGPGEYPYKTILKEQVCESAAYILKELGYTAFAVHNNEANFYSRKRVFANLGYDYFVPEEYMPGEEDKNPLGWVRDEILTGEIQKCLARTEGPDYIYTISVQGHGEYPGEYILDDPAITVTGAPSDELNAKWEYYVNQVREMDSFVGELTKALSELDEDVLLVMYGDHIPTMDLTAQDLASGSLFYTPYVIWDNFGLEKKDGILASYQMAAEVMDRIGVHEGTLFRYHQARRGSKNYFSDLELMQYDMLYGQKYCYGGTSPFKKTKMQLGLEPLLLTGIYPSGRLEAPGYYLMGSGFTPSSQARVNGEWADTAYISGSCLMLTGTELLDFDCIDVAQRSNSSTRKALSSSEDRSVCALDRRSDYYEGEKAPS